MEPANTPVGDRERAIRAQRRKLAKGTRVSIGDGRELGTVTVPAGKDGHSVTLAMDNGATVTAGIFAVWILD